MRCPTSVHGVYTESTAKIDSQLNLQVLHSRFAFLYSSLQTLDIPLDSFTINLQRLERCLWLQMKECVALLISMRGKRSGDSV